MISTRTVWNTPQVVAEIKASSFERLLRAAVFFWQKCAEAVGISNPRPYKTPSLPGEPPRKRTGFGQRNILYEVNKAEGWIRVGVSVNAAYMAYLDQGTQTIKPRPWLLATFEKFKDTIQSLAGSKSP